jgi:teichuronic acid biosynthesis glycosyltransferase TuaH
MSFSPIIRALPGLYRCCWKHEWLPCNIVTGTLELLQAGCLSHAVSAMASFAGEGDVASMVEVSKVGGRDVVFTFSTETLADARQREFCRPPDQALLAICRANDRINRILVVNPWRSSPAVAFRALTSRGQREPQLNGVSLLRPLRLRRRDPTRLPAIQRSYRRYDAILERHVRRLGLEDPALLTFHLFVAAFCPLRWASTVTFYARDDWAAAPSETPLWPAYRQAYHVLRERGTRIICVSSEIATRVAAGEPVVVLPNGVDRSLWSHSLPPPPPAVLDLRRPIVTYAGTINGRLDTEIVAKVADDDAVGSIALIGPVENDALTERLRRIPKVTLCGSMSQRDLVGALMHTDVCFLPHVNNPQTRAMSPLKLYEYLAAGKPVVTTDLPPVRGISDRVIPASIDHFPKAIRTALSLHDQDEDERLEFVRANSWETRHNRTLKVMLADDMDWWKS